MLSPALCLMLLTSPAPFAPSGVDEGIDPPSASMIAEDAPPTAGPQANREAQAKRLYEAGRFGEAALEFEALWRDFEDPRYLYNAASSRFVLEHYAHAAHYLARYLDLPTLGSGDHTDAREQLEAASRRLRKLSIQVADQIADPGSGEGSGSGITVEVEHLSDLVSDLRPPLAVELDPMTSGFEGAISLDPGRWRVRARSGDGREATTEVTLRGPMSVLLELPQAAPTQQDPVDPQPSLRPYVLGFAVSGGASALVGGALTTVTALRAKGLLEGDERCTADLPGCRQRLVRSLNGRAWGTGLIGLGAGAAVGGLTGLINDPRRRRSAWIVETSTGGALALVGVVSLFVGARLGGGVTSPASSQWGDFAAWSAAFREESSGAVALHSAGGLLLGLGAGLVASSATGLALTASSTTKQRRAAIELRPSLGGLQLLGRF